MDNGTDKWKLLPMFLQVRGLMSQHIQSFNYLINEDLKNIVLSPVNREVRSEVNSNFFLRYDDLYVGCPILKDDYNGSNSGTVTPQICRLRGMTYSAPIYVDVKYSKIFGKRLVVHSKKKVCIGRIPIMLKSSKCVLYNKSEDGLAKLQECPYDPGGYFVVKGREKVVLIQEQQSKNRILLTTDSVNNVYADVQSSTHEVKSRTYVVLKKDSLHMKHNSFVEELPIIIVLKAMDLESDILIYKSIGMNEHSHPGQRIISNSFEFAARLGIVTTEQALDYISKRIRRFQKSTYFQKKSMQEKLRCETRDVLADYVLNHIQVKSVGQYDFRRKTFYICLMVRQVLEAQFNRKLLDDRDDYCNKRLELSGQLMSLLFEDLFKRFNAELKRQTDKILNKSNQAVSFDMLSKLSNDRLITSGFVNALSTGNWILKRFKMERKGVTQQLSRLSYMAALGHITRINSQFEKTRKVAGPRALQPSQWGNICIADTPEGESCGLVKNLALLCHVTSECDPKSVIKVCYNLGVEILELYSGEELYRNESDWKNTVQNKKYDDIYIEGFEPGPFLVMVNGQLIGLHRQPIKFARQLRNLRRKRRLNEFVSIFVNTMKRIIFIATDGGRLCRPLIIVDKKTNSSMIKPKHIERLSQLYSESKKTRENDKIAKFFESLLSKGYIEYLDVNESNNTLIALHDNDIEDETTHVEIEPLTILGVVAGLIPFPHHNQSPRNTYQCAMGKQSMGFTGYNQFKRFDTLLYSLIYSQKPLVKTRTLDLVNFDKISSGMNAIIAVMSFTGYDIEDAIILNKSSLDRGMARCMEFRTFETSKKTSATNQSDIFLEPKGKIKKTEEGIGRDGIIHEGTRIRPGHKLVNKLVPDDNSMPTGSNLNFAPTQSVAYKAQPLKYIGPKSAAVDKVMLTSNQHDKFLCRVKIRDVRRPELGDKFSSRHGQKGVCGLIVRQEDMPFADSGICPDLIMNPHGFPSRMTVGKMLELICGKAAVCDGKFKYGTAFSGDKLEDMKEILKSNGFSYTGKDMLTSGTTGEPLEAYIFMGPVYYQKLKHMVVDKMHARPRGPKTLLTRQPTEGRSRGGGLRVGEMERDCLVAYGASSLLIERLMLSSDIYEATFCTRCGKLSQPHSCSTCTKSDKLSSVKMPYACKLMFQELESMNIFPRVKFKANT